MKTKLKDREINVNTNPRWLILLGCILVLLKLTGYTQVATLSWWIVLLPFYAGIAIFFAFIALAMGFFAIVYVVAWIIDKVQGR